MLPWNHLLSCCKTLPSTEVIIWGPDPWRVAVPPNFGASWSCLPIWEANHWEKWLKGQPPSPTTHSARHIYLVPRVGLSLSWLPLPTCKFCFMDFGGFSPTHGPQLGPSQPLSLILMMLIVKREVTNISISSPAHQRLLIPTQFHLCSAMTSCVTPSDIVSAGLHQPQTFSFYYFLKIIGVPTHPRICNSKAFKSEWLFKSLPG